MQRTRLNPSQAIDRFLENTENTMNAELSASVATVLLNLAQKYLPAGEIDSNILKRLMISIVMLNEGPLPGWGRKHIEEKLRSYLNLLRFREYVNDEKIRQYLDELEKTIACHEGDELLLEAWEFMKIRIAEPANDHDRVTVWQNGEWVEYYISLRETLALVYAALTDKSIKPEEQSFRLETLWRCLKELHAKQVCHQGNRHELAFTLNGVYPGVSFIEDFEAFLADIGLQYIDDQLKKFREDRHTYLQILLYEISKTNERHPELAKHLYSKRDIFRQAIRKKCIANGINPEEAELSNKINNYVDCINDLELPLGSQANIHCLKFLMQERVTENKKGMMVGKVKEWIRTAFELDQAEKEDQLKSFARVYNIHSLFQAYEVLQYWDHEKIHPDQIALLKSQLEEYCSVFLKPESKSPGVASGNLCQLMTVFENACLAYKKDALVDWIENFFVHYFTETGPYSLVLGKLLDPLVQEKIIVPDIILKKQFPDCVDEVYLNPYWINRIFLHAIVVPPKNWTPLFGNILSRVYEFVSEGFNENTLQSSNLKEYSYWKQLMTQLEVCLSFHYKKEGVIIVNGYWDVIPMPHTVNDDRSLSRALDILSRDERSFFLMKMGERLKDIIGWDFNSVKCGLIDKVSKDDLWPLMMNVYGIERLRTMLDRGKNVGIFLKHLSSADQLTAIELLGREHLIADKTDPHAEFDQLTSMLIHVGDDPLTIMNHFGIDFIKKIISNYHAYERVLRILPEADQLSLINDSEMKSLKCIVRTFHELVSVLFETAKPNRMSIIKKLGVESLNALIKTDDHLLCMLDVLNTNHSDFIKVIKYIRCKDIDFSTPVLYQLYLSRLPKKDRDTFITCFGAERLIEYIFNTDDLLAFLRESTENGKITIVETLGLSRLKKMIESKSQLQDIQKSLPEFMHEWLDNIFEWNKTDDFSPKKSAIMIHGIYGRDIKPEQDGSPDERVSLRSGCL